ncbi:hypothetical protein HY621_01280 [Candidatus Uhrbacteria bacterium]|nr:hypothetical protein [Candidatus Uhrbacteria bacterium]
MRNTNSESEKRFNAGETLKDVYKQMNMLAPFILSAAGVGVGSALDLGSKQDVAFAATQLEKGPPQIGRMVNTAAKPEANPPFMKIFPISEKRTVEWSKIRPLYSWLVQDKKGNTYFDLLGAISLGVEIPTNLRFQKVSIGELTSKYARKFSQDKEAGKPVREQDRAWLADEVQHELQEVFVDLLRSWDVTGGRLTEGVARYAHRSDKASKIGERVKAIYMAGVAGASPEGPQEKGPKTISWGSVDPENIDLALVRAGNLDTAYRAAFMREGISHPKKVELRGKEYQFSLKELQILEALSKEYPGDTVEEKIFNLHVAYNKTIKSGVNQLKDPSMRPILDAIIGGKRNAREILEWEGNRKETYMGSIPVLLLFLPKLGKILIDRLKRKKEHKPPRGPLQKPLRTLPEKTRLPGVPDAIRNSTLPPLGSKEYEDFRERVLLDDFDLFFRHGPTERGGINYESLLNQTKKELRGKSQQYKAIDEIELVLAEKILKAWEEHDKKKNPRAYYQKDAQQIKEARMHAQIVVDLALKQKEKPLQKITATLDEITRPYKHRRATRYAADMAKSMRKTNSPRME